MCKKMVLHRVLEPKSGGEDILAEEGIEVAVMGDWFHMEELAT